MFFFDSSTSHCQYFEILIFFNCFTGIDWFSNFMQRNNLSVRKPEATSIARQTAFNKVAVDGFFKRFSDIMTRYIFSFNIYKGVLEIACYSMLFLTTTFLTGMDLLLKISTTWMRREFQQSSLLVTWSLKEERSKLVPRPLKSVES